MMKVTTLLSRKRNDESLVLVVAPNDVGSRVVLFPMWMIMIMIMTMMTMKIVLRRVYVVFFVEIQVNNRLVIGQNLEKFELDVVVFVDILVVVQVLVGYWHCRSSYSSHIQKNRHHDHHRRRDYRHTMTVFRNLFLEKNL